MRPMHVLHVPSKRNLWSCSLCASKAELVKAIACCARRSKTLTGYGTSALWSSIMATIMQAARHHRARTRSAQLSTSQVLTQVADGPWHRPLPPIEHFTVKSSLIASCDSVKKAHRLALA